MHCDLHVEEVDGAADVFDARKVLHVDDAEELGLVGGARLRGLDKVRLAVDGLEAAGEPRVRAEHVAGALREEFYWRVRAFKYVGDADGGLAEVERLSGHELYGNRGHGWLWLYV